MVGSQDIDTAGVSILVVDDEESIVRMMELILKRIGYNVTGTTDCNVAMQALEDNTYTVLITDLRMSPIDGRKLLLFTRHASPDTRVIIISAYTSEEAEQEARSMGAAGYLNKPFRVDDLLDAIKAVL